MAELLTQLLQIIVAAALSIIGVEYEPARDDSETRRVEAAFMLAPALYTVPEGKSVRYEFIADECESRSADVKSYDAEKPLFVGVTGYQS